MPNSALSKRLGDLERHYSIPADVVAILARLESGTPMSDLSDEEVAAILALPGPDLSQLSDEELDTLIQRAATRR